MLVLPGICISWIVLFFNPEGLLIKKKKGERFGLSVPIPDVVVQVAEDWNMEALIKTVYF